MGSLGTGGVLGKKCFVVAEKWTLTWTAVEVRSAKVVVAGIIASVGLVKVAWWSVTGLLSGVWELAVTSVDVGLSEVFLVSADVVGKDVPGEVVS